MSFIQFESAREKDKARQDLREAREQMLNEAKKRAEQRAERDTKRFLKDGTNWMLPTVKEKLEKRSKQLKKSKKKKEKKESKKSKKTSRKHSTSEDESDSSDDTTTDTDSSSSDNKHKKHKKSKKLKKCTKNSKNKKTSSSNTPDEDSGDKPYSTNLNKSEEPLKRDGWMTGALMIKTYSREHKESKSNVKQQIDVYDPVKSTRELNHYWKTTGTGLPAFQKPKDEGDFKNTKSEKSTLFHSSIGSKGWRKQCDKASNECLGPQRKISRKPNDESSSSEKEYEREAHEKSAISTSEFLTDQQMNELGAKLLKAEIMGNMKLADELREKLEKARQQRNIFKERQKSTFTEAKQYNSQKTNSDKSEINQDEHILLTHTDQAGHSRPIPASTVLDPRDLYGGKKKPKRVNCHDESGKRVRYFADDDRYDIKQMFEREKYISASDANLQFANIAGKHRIPNDDLEDIFTENISKDAVVRSDHKDRNRAIREHQKMEAALDNCDKCFGSTKMQKELLVCVGDNVYLSLPWYQGLQPGHCMIVPNQHASCCTQIDEDIWTEVNEFRKALTRMFAAQHKDVIFFEIANKLHKRPHLVIHCIPIREADGEMAPFYFKKAIEESEHEWCVNKQLVSLRHKSLRNSIPKGLPYFWVHFGMDTGFAHVIEDEERFPKNFAQEIIGGMLNLDAKKWRQQQKEQNIITKVKMLADWWKKYDCTK